ncbi:murein hydrolase activator EnvC family protein [Algibacillus agarilyticus]|uniref:murein hydrolase activator EnvC family protein n=1 Tax=Algibacillus agarilyticus TaxID=2234133 RepID=UPI000DCFCAA4|nr:peptidoglycan DD-metalloendopeptidase family protein [Algibacillus agarilyticus]
MLTHKRVNNKTASIFAGCFAFLCFTFAFINTALADQQTEQQLEAKQKLQDIQTQIKDKNQAIIQGKNKQNQTEVAIQKTDVNIGKTARQLKQTQQKLKTVQDNLVQLNKQKNELEKVKKQQLTVLAKQIKSAYQVGQHDYLMMLLNQESPAKLERVLTYYQYFNKARIKAVDSLKQTVTAIEQNAQALYEQKNELNQLLAQQIESKQQLSTLKQQQKMSLVQLRNKLKTEQANLKRLKESENSLNELLDQLASAVANIPDLTEWSGLQNYKGKLKWPTSGRVNKVFGQRKRGPIRWKGLMIDGKLGANVKNIHAGQVIFADWMKGFGLVLVIDHGKGYMSLYGHNQSLLKDVGDIVEAGEAIAEVGQSGGQTSPSLYFEIRHQGTPLDPKLWCQ